MGSRSLRISHSKPINSLVFYICLCLRRCFFGHHVEGRLRERVPPPVLVILEKSEGNLLFFILTSISIVGKQVKHSPQCKFLSSSTTVPSVPSARGSEPTTRGRKQSLDWMLFMIILCAYTHILSLITIKKKKN